MSDNQTTIPFTAHDDLSHYAIWASTRDRGGAIGSVALMDGGTVLLISKAAIESGNLPSGVTRMLTVSDFEACNQATQ